MIWIMWVELHGTILSSKCWAHFPSEVQMIETDEKGYGKEEAIRMAWTFLTERVRLLPSKLRVTVHRTDSEAKDVWHRLIGLPLERILEGEEDNFWTMGDGPGPCGPCTEIFYEQAQPDADGELWLEIWNLVFMEHFRDPSGTLTPLPLLCVDTGMGLERLGGVVQNEPSNYSNDLFRRLSAPMGAFLGPTPSADERVAVQVITDHFRAAAFLIADGVTPSPTGRGYVLRRLIRRAATYGNRLGISGPFLGTLFPALVESMGSVYPELFHRSEVISRVVEAEERLFGQTLREGWKTLQEMIRHLQLSHGTELPPAFVFQLWDSFGFPIDLTSHWAQRAGLKVEEEKVKQLMEEQKERGRASWKGSGSALLPSTVRLWKSQGIFPVFSGYDRLSEKSVLVAVEEDEEGLWLAIDPTPFYPMGGGQIGDVGTVTFPSGIQLKVSDSQRPYPGGAVIRVEGSPEDISRLRQLGELTPSLPGSQDPPTLHVEVTSSERLGAARSHTATHLVHAALRRVLGLGIQQNGSWVGPDRLRFDFSFPRALSAEELDHVTQWVRRVIDLQIPVSTRETSYTEAVESGAIALFSEKYGETVRVVDIPEWSQELCGGTHVTNTREVGLFLILSDTSIASGTRRIEAVTGKGAEEFLLSTFQSHKRVASLLNVSPPSVSSAVESLVAEVKELQSSLKSLQRDFAAAAAQTSSPTVGSLGTPPVPLKVRHLPPSVTPSDLRTQIDQTRSQDPAAIQLWRCGDRVTLSVGEKVNLHAGKLLGKLLTPLGGKGGGKPELAHGSCPSTVSTDSILQVALSL